MIYLLPLFPIVIPLLVFIFPGILLPTFRTRANDHLGQAIRIAIFSLSLLILTSLLLAAFGLPPFIALILAIATSFLWLLHHRSSFSGLCQPSYLLILILFLVTYTAFSLPWLFYHHGLPTGDSQKAIVWANNIITQQQFPDYSISPTLLNRDPMDFYTPGLHSLTAMIMQSTPTSPGTSFLPFTTVGFFSLASAIAIASLAFAIGRQVLPSSVPLWLFFTIPIFVLTNYRFLRYIREPGYHFQNVIGELLLWSLVYLFICLIKKFSLSDLLLIIICSLSLFLTHQFSAFLAAFLLLPSLLFILIKYYHQISIAFSRRWLFLSLSLISILLFSFLALGLHQKVTHIFNINPHLSSLTPHLIDYPLTMGVTWFSLAILGLVTLAIYFVNHRHHLATGSFVFSSLIILILSQGPRLFIDIPPVRALFFSVVPLSVTAAYGLFFIYRSFSSLSKHLPRLIILTVIIALVLLPASYSLLRAYQLSHQVRTNSTLLPQYFPLISHIKQLSSASNQAVLIDDYNRRSSSWLVLSEQPMFTRIAADLQRQMNEARQSPTRYDLYLKQLDFEKIFSLGSHPDILPLLSKHNIAYLTGINKSSNFAFSHNPALAQVSSGYDIMLYQSTSPNADHQSPHSQTLSNWLLRPTTLVNDIGDHEDTYLHLPASLRATRLSDPLSNSHQTWRTSTSPYIPISFNVGDFVDILWDQDNNDQPDSSLELLILTTSQDDTLSVTTPKNATYEVPTDGTLTKLPASHFTFSDDGIITLIIHNPQQKNINLDLIALGLSHTP